MPKIIQLGSPFVAGQSPYDVFQNRISAINSLAQGIGKMMKNKYYSGLLSATVEDITNPASGDKVGQASSLITQEPSADAVNQQEILDFSTSMVDFLEQSTHGAMYNKEILKGNLPVGATDKSLLPAQNIVGEKGVTEQPFVLPKGSIKTILSYVESMGGNINLTKAMEMIKKRPKYMSPNNLEQSILNYALKQPSPQQQLLTNVKTAKTLQDILYPEIGEQKEIDMYKNKLITREEVKKQFKGQPLSAEAIKEKVNAMTPEGFEATNIQYAGGDQINVNLKKIAPDAKGLTLEDLKTRASKQGLQVYSVNLDENGEMSNIRLINPEIKTTTTNRVTTAEANFATKEFTNVKTNEQYAKALERVRTVDKNVPVPSKSEIFEGNYNKAINLINQLIDEQGRIKNKVTPKNKMPFSEVYKKAYKDLEIAIKEYQKATGIEIPNPFVSPEEYETKDVKPNTINPFTWGKQKSVFK